MSRPPFTELSRDDILTETLLQVVSGIRSPTQHRRSLFCQFIKGFAENGQLSGQAQEPDLKSITSDLGVPKEDLGA